MRNKLSAFLHAEPLLGNSSIVFQQSGPELSIVADTGWSLHNSLMKKEQEACDRATD